MCAADDCDAPHDKQMSVPDDSTVSTLAARIQKEYVPSNIQGGKATWSLVSRIPLAVIAQQWRTPKLVQQTDPSIASLSETDGCVKLHVNCHRQDPDTVLEILRELKLETIQQPLPHVQK